MRGESWYKKELGHTKLYETKVKQIESYKRLKEDLNKKSVLYQFLKQLKVYKHLQGQKKDDTDRSRSCDPDLLYEPY